MAVADIYELTQSYRVRGEWCENVLHFREKTAETDPIPAENLALGWDISIKPDLVALLSDEVILACVYARRISPTPGIAFTVLQTDVGIVASEAVPSLAAVITTWYTGTFTGRGRGRTYWPGLPESMQNSGSLTAAALTNWQALADLLEIDLAAGGGGTGVWELCVWSQASLTAAIVLAGIARSNMASMRSRRQKPGAS